MRARIILQTCCSVPNSLSTEYVKIQSLMKHKTKQKKSYNPVNLIHTTWCKDKRSSKRLRCLHKLFIWYEWKFNEKLLNLMWCNMLEQSVLEWLEHVVWQCYRVKILWSQMFVWLWATACTHFKQTTDEFILAGHQFTWNRNSSYNFQQIGYYLRVF